jgi:hypothetical protein
MSKQELCKLKEGFHVRLKSENKKQLWVDVQSKWKAEEQPCRYDWSTLEYQREQTYDGQSPGNCMRKGISIQGMIKLLRIICFDSFHIKHRHEPFFYQPETNLSWNEGVTNGYDLCSIVIPAYLQKIGLPHLSLVECIESGKVEELLPLQAEIGMADVFFSQ